MSADVVWERNLDVRVRLAGGRLALILGEVAHTLPPPLAWVWRRVDGAIPAERIYAEADVEQADEVRTTVQRLVDGGFLLPARPSA